jgi:hypothetical protein
MRLIGTREIAPIGPVFKRSSMLFAENAGVALSRLAGTGVGSGQPARGRCKPRG